MTLRQVVALFVKKLGESAVAYDPHELEIFRKQIKAVHDLLTPDLPMENLLIATGSATQALETYNQRFMRIVGKQSRDFREIVKLLQDHLTKMTGSSNHSMENLSKIGEELDRLADFKDVEPLKHHLTQCLSGLREEIQREKFASKELIDKLRVDIEGFRESEKARLQPDQARIDSGGAGSDPATGLRHEGECVAAMQAAIKKGTRHYAAVMVVNRVQQMNARYGRAAGDLMLSRFREIMEGRIVAPDQLFRWTGPAMVAILERPQPFTAVRLLVKQLADVRDDVTFEFGNRSVHIPISANWSVFPLEANPSVAVTQIDAFIASQGNHDFS
jgi:GGDEF domain-containing protein